MSENNFEMPQMGTWPKKTIYTVIGVILVIFFLVKSTITIDSGYAGVIYKPFAKGVDTKTTYGEGFHLMPLGIPCSNTKYANKKCLRN
jgi:hypothetical protein